MMHHTQHRASWHGTERAQEGGGRRRRAGGRGSPYIHTSVVGREEVGGYGPDASSRLPRPAETQSKDLDRNGPCTIKCLF